MGGLVAAMQWPEAISVSVLGVCAAAVIIAIVNRKQ
jgi:hypothetical protein